MHVYYLPDVVKKWPVDRKEKLACLVAAIETLFRTKAADISEGECSERTKRSMVSELWTLGSALLHVHDGSAPEANVLAELFVQAANRGDRAISISGTPEEVEKEKAETHRQFAIAYAAVALSIKESEVIRSTVDNPPSQVNKSGDP